jgi:hypothetical protein
MLATKPGLLSTDERRQAKDAATALQAVLDRDEMGAPAPDAIDLQLQGNASDVWYEEKYKRQIKYLSLIGVLNSKASGAEAAGLGAATAIPGAQAFSKLVDKARNKTMSDAAFSGVMGQIDPYKNAQEAHPGLYAAGNIAASLPLMAAGGAGLKAAGIGSQAARDAILFGTQAGINSAASQDWSKPWEAAGKTALDTFFGAGGGAALGKAADFAAMEFAQYLAERNLRSTVGAGIDTTACVLDNSASDYLAGTGQKAQNQIGNAANGAGDVGQYTQKIKWGIQDVEVRPVGKGFFGQRTQQINPRVDAYELKINPNNESYYLKSLTGGYVQYENMVNDVVMDGKLVIQQKSFYHINNLPDFARNKVLQEATMQVEAANNVGYAVEWLISDPIAVAQLADFFKSKNINIVVKYFPE